MLEMTRRLEQSRQLHTYHDVENDVVLFYGLTKMVEIIGEAAYKLTHDFKETHHELPWREIIGMRHLLVHGYFAVNEKILWDVITNDIPNMIPILENYIKELSNQQNR